MKPLPLTTYITTIENLSHDGRGVAHIEGKTVFIENALPNEQVRFQYRKKHRAYDEAFAVEVLTTSPDRVAPPCPYDAICGGCSLLHCSTNAQLKHKQSALLEQLKHFGQIEPEHIVDPIQAHTLGYRTKARLGVHYLQKKDLMFVGFREKNGRYIADIQSCAVLHASIGTKVHLLRELISHFSIKHAIPQIEVAVGDTETALVIRHLEPFLPEELDQLCQFGAKEHLSIYLQPKNMASIHKIFPKDANELLSYTLPDHQVTIQFHPCDFKQVNQAINNKMVSRAIEWLELNNTDTVLDLFCGLGNFSLPMVKYCKKVIGVEGSLEMVERARKNAKNNQLTSVEFFVSNLFEPVKSQPWFSQTANKLLLDPPRSGALEIIQQLKNVLFEKIVYISCNPATFARDAGELVHQQGYHLKYLGILDMFPHTTHVESIALFTREKAK